MQQRQPKCAREKL